MTESKQCKTENPEEIRFKGLADILTAEERRKQISFRQSLTSPFYMSSIHLQMVFLGDVLEDTATMSCYLHKLVFTFLMGIDEGFCGT